MLIRAFSRWIENKRFQNKEYTQIQVDRRHMYLYSTTEIAWDKIPARI